MDTQISCWLFYAWEGNRFASMHLVSFKRISFIQWTHLGERAVRFGKEVLTDGTLLACLVQDDVADFGILFKFLLSITFQRDWTLYSDLSLCMNYWESTVSTPLHRSIHHEYHQFMRNVDRAHVFSVVFLKLKGHSTNFIHEIQFTRHKSSTQHVKMVV